MRRFFDFCLDNDFECSFNYHSICAFCQHYVAGFDDGTDTKVKAFSSLPKFLSAWADYADDNFITDFPFKKTAARRRVNRFIKGLSLRFPFEQQKDSPLVLDILARVAPYYDINSAADLWLVPTSLLCRWARIIIAHDACMRPVEHSKGCRVSDVIDNGDFVTLLVGSRKGEQKYDGKGRIAVLCAVVSHLSAGYVIRVVMDRVHGFSVTDDGAPPPQVADLPADVQQRCLLPHAPSVDVFPYLDVDVSPTAAHQPWGEALAFLRTSCKQLRVPNALVITGRALRAGGATDWFAADAHSLWVKAQGGWASDAYLVYNRPSPRQRAVMGRVYTKVVFSRQAAHSVSNVTA